MSEKLALKRLTASDLTFFEWHFKNRNAGNQKAINLNADVFAGRLYPAVEAVARQSQNKLGVDLWIGGPGAASPHNYQRKIIKGAAYKNWRLDGEVVYNPETDPERFNGLRPGDLALLGFDGDLVPNTMHLVLVAKSAPEDSELFTRLDETAGGPAHGRAAEQLPAGSSAKRSPCRGHIRRGCSLPRRTSRKPLSVKPLPSLGCSLGPGREECPLKTSKRRGGRPRNSAGLARASWTFILSNAEQREKSPSTSGPPRSTRFHRTTSAFGVIAPGRSWRSRRRQRTSTVSTTYP